VARGAAASDSRHRLVVAVAPSAVGRVCSQNSASGLAVIAASDAPALAVNVLMIYTAPAGARVARL
jgi:hypothetical protein